VLSLLDAAGDVSHVVPLDSDRLLSSLEILHLVNEAGGEGEPGVLFSLAGGGVRLDPRGSRHDVFVFINAPTALSDGDVMLLGTQYIRYRELTTSGARLAPGRLGTNGSPRPAPDVAALEQMGDAGRVRDVLHLWPGRTVVIGRGQGEWLFSYDPTMSNRHAEVRCDGGAGGTTVRDLGSRNGVAIRARNAQLLSGGQRVSLAGQLLRVDLA
jgi:hypothetical protein